MCLQALEANTESAWEHSAVRSVDRRETILFVEDENFVRDVTGEVLRSAGYRVLAVRNATEALFAYNEYLGEIDLLLSDVILPGESGRSLAKNLKLKNPALAVLLVTGYVEQMARQEAEHAECLAKPFSTEVLLRKIRELLNGRRAWFEKQRPEKVPVRRVSGNA
jgi:two-component system, cell cycle sensor histidine kinase and response regulator CckA